MRNFVAFNLVRSYTLLSLLSITLVSAVSGVTLFRFLARHMIERDVVVASQFLQSVAHINDPTPYFTGSVSEASRGQLQEFFAHITQMPYVFRANVYNHEGRILWSSFDDLTGRQFSFNSELEQALQGEVVFKIEHHADDKEEHLGLPESGDTFVESYFPIRSRDGQIIGVVEMYKTPTELLQTIDTGAELVVATAFGSGLFLFVTLFWLVRRANTTIVQQHGRLLENERMATVGMMSSAIAHSIRNPLASIRASAELTLEAEDLDEARESSTDIIAEADQLNQRVRELLLYSKTNGVAAHSAAVDEVLRETLDNFAHRAELQGVTVHEDLNSGSAAVRGERVIIDQILRSVIANAFEAMPGGGPLHVRSFREGDAVQVVIKDSGVGMTPELMEKIFEPFFTNKAQGLGLGLPLVRHLLQMSGGHVDIASEPDSGTEVKLTFAVVSHAD